MNAEEQKYTELNLMLDYFFFLEKGKNKITKAVVYCKIRPKGNKGLMPGSFNEI